MFFVVMLAWTGFGRSFREQPLHILCVETWVVDSNHFGDAGVVLPFAAREGCGDQVPTSGIGTS